ncbi:hypothetical protein [Chromobacterium haemolyticum]|uniref:hypothetical protein n=1 Tax=Chromobacterium haemolyticum TaxID=394935 RepID=UPI0009DA5F38|nr:hypothetical protein [Chromobacterium haemolyticum]OQS40532.1 hypothetical protein B0T39_10935 [Chromobacterium haemolyticum]
MDKEAVAVVVETSAVTVVVEQTPELRVIEGVPGPVGPRGKNVVDDFDLDIALLYQIAKL